jgi:hypothetical protein
MTRDEARGYFANRGLTYSDITEGDICSLTMLLNKHLKAANKENLTSVDMRMSEKIKSKYKSNGTIIECYLFMNSHYFTRREAISFDKNGFIGFAGWASDGNILPLTAAFKEWVDGFPQDIESTESHNEVEAVSGLGQAL